jgi:hypothetical protein
MKQLDLLPLLFSVFIFNNLHIAEISSITGMLRQSGKDQTTDKQGTASIPGRMNSLLMFIGFIS